MRYLLYESEQGNSKLSTEIEFMTNYVDLMRLRLSEKVSLKVTFPAAYNDISIPPLLFIPFIENAFKHGISYREPSFIDISLEVNGKEILFSCNNSLGLKVEESSDVISGIGLENVKKRLALLYPQTHSLIITQTESSFHVILKIDTSQS
jgi:two-component system, LytTR family, sensor kinase